MQSSARICSRKLLPVIKASFVSSPKVVRSIHSFAPSGLCHCSRSRAQSAFDERPSRFFSTGASQNNANSGLIPLQECITIAEKTLVSLKSSVYSLQIEALKSSKASVGDKWNQAVWLVLKARMEPLKEKGLTGNDAFQYSHRVHVSAQMHMQTTEGQQLAKADHTIWQMLFSVIFGLEHPKRLDVKTVRKISLDLCIAISQDDFIDSLREETKDLPREARNPIVIGMLQKLAMKVFAKHGLYGDAGYLAVQKALVDYSSDPYIASMTHAYNHITTEAAGLNQ